MRRLSVLLAALLVPAAQPLLLAAAIPISAIMLFQTPAMAQSAEAVAKVAEAITVRVEGATQGSGVLVKREGNRYTVLTAWHVVSGQRPGEELDIYTPDGQRHKYEQGSIKRLGLVDMAVLTFSTLNFYEVARVGEVKSIRSGETVLVAGFPVGSNGRLKYDTGRLVANAAIGIDQGYQLLYNNDTAAGMSGGVVLKSDGTLIGMHGRGELDELKSRQFDTIIKTGINQGVPISYYSLFDAGSPVVASSEQASTADDYLAQAVSILSKGMPVGDNRYESTYFNVIRLSTKYLELNPNSAEAYGVRARAQFGVNHFQQALEDANKGLSIDSKNWNAYFARANAKSKLGDRQGAISDFSQALSANPHFAFAYYGRGLTKIHMGDLQGAISDFSQSLAINPQDAVAYDDRGHAKQDLGDMQGALRDYNEALARNPQLANTYSKRGIVKSYLGDKHGAIDDYSQAIAVDPKLYNAYANRGLDKHFLGDKKGALADYNKALVINPQFAGALFNRGNVKRDLGDSSGAMADYSKALSINPQYAKVYVNRALIWQQIGNKSRMCADMQNATRFGIAQKDYYSLCQ